jgi:acyl-CoA thioesterase I
MQRYRMIFLICLFVAIQPRSSFGQKPEAREVPVIVFIGDSITQGYGVQPDQAFPEVIQRMFDEKKIAVKIVNAGISGSVTSDADRRVRFYSRLQPAIYFICLGANDALKATPTDLIQKNLASALNEISKQKATAILGGMKVFSNYGEKYSKQLEAVYRELAAERKVSLIPFLLEGVALDKKLMQADAKHPNLDGHIKIAKLIYPVISKELTNVRK